MQKNSLIIEKFTCAGKMHVGVHFRNRNSFILAFGENPPVCLKTESTVYKIGFEVKSLPLRLCLMLDI